MAGTYDIGIIGAGAAGLQLAMAIANDPWFNEKTILIVDKDKKDVNDKTWCYWEKGNGKWDHLIHKNWSAGKFITHQKDIHLELGAYTYKMLRSIDFYEYARKSLESRKNFNWLQDDVIETMDQKPVAIRLTNSTVNAHHVFDSRIDPNYSLEDKNYIHVLQHFKGWRIQTNKDKFDPSWFTMMDYRPRLKSTTSFMYVLPISPNEALLEFTFFSPNLVQEEVYEEVMREYINSVLQIDKYSILSEEKGIIPMTNYPFHSHSSNSITKIGTAGSWVKASSGYSFHNTGVKIDQLISNMKNGIRPDAGLIQKRFRIYDLLFLDILNQHNEKGEQLFTTMFSKNPVENIFEFLDETSSLHTDLKILSSFRPWPFIAAGLRQIF